MAKYLFIGSSASIIISGFTPMKYLLHLPGVKHRCCPYTAVILTCVSQVLNRLNLLQLLTSLTLKGADTRCCLEGSKCCETGCQYLLIRLLTNLKCRLTNA